MPQKRKNPKAKKKIKEIKVVKGLGGRVKHRAKAELGPGANSAFNPELDSGVEEDRSSLEDAPIGPRVQIIGIGGGGGAIVAEIAQKVKMVEFIAVDTDRKAFKGLPKNLKRFWVNQTSDGSIREPCLKRIKNLFKGTDFCVLISCLGGETGFNTSPIFAEASRRHRMITLGIFVLPFEFEGEEKTELAKLSLQKIKPILNASMVISNQKLFNIINKNTYRIILLSPFLY